MKKRTMSELVFRARVVNLLDFLQRAKITFDDQDGRDAQAARELIGCIRRSLHYSWFQRVCDSFRGVDMTSVLSYGAWNPIDSAPKNDKVCLYLARFDANGYLREVDCNATWEYWSDHEDGQVVNEGYDWRSSKGIEAPTHWAYQDIGAPPLMIPTIDKE